KLDPAEIQDAILHGAIDFLSAPCSRTLVKRCDDPKPEMQAGAAIANLGSSDKRQALAEACGRGCPARALRDILIDLAILERSRPKPLDRRNDHTGIELLNTSPSKPHAVKNAWREILHQNVADLNERGKNLHPFGIFGVERDRALIVVQHCKIEA